MIGGNIMAKEISKDSNLEVVVADIEKKLGK